VSSAAIVVAKFRDLHELCLFVRVYVPEVFTLVLNVERRKVRRRRRSENGEHRGRCSDSMRDLASIARAESVAEEVASPAYVSRRK
jgi:hypothetical protein